jgi:preprotein translocase subunit SecD
MSSDYIARLRQELLRAGATQPARRRWAPSARTLRPLAAAAAVALVAVVAVLAWPETRVDQPAGGVQLTYRLGTADAERTAEVMRARLAAAGIGDATVGHGSGGLTITAPASARADVTALVAPGRLAIHDWERTVLGPRGAPAPADDEVTGNPDPGNAAALSREEAEARARAALPARLARGAGGWYALGGAPAIGNAAVERAQPAVDPMTEEPIVAIDLTASGQRAFETLTRELARRGAERARDGVGREEAWQHFAIVLDDRILSVPFIDFREVPDGIDGRSGMQIGGGLTPDTARRIAALLSAGPLAAGLELESETAADG